MNSLPALHDALLLKGFYPLNLQSMESWDPKISILMARDTKRKEALMFPFNAVMIAISVKPGEFGVATPRFWDGWVVRSP